MNLIKKMIPLLLAIVAICLSLTPFYSIGYILVITLLSLYLNNFGIFKTFIQKIFLLLFLLTAIVPVVGLLCWFMQVSVQPVYCLVLLILFSIAFLEKNPSQWRSLKGKFSVEKVDMVAIALAVMPVIILILSFGAAPNSKASLFQLSSEGWDNGSHILMMEANSSANGYAYGPYEDMKDELIQGFNAYPQSWHLATSHLVNGFGGNRFIASNPMGVILAYTIATIAWMMSLIYLFVLTLWRFYEHLANKSPRAAEISVIISITVLTTIVVFIASLMHGFTNYIGTLVYICLSIAMIMEFAKKGNLKSYSMFIIFSLAAILSWFLVLPALAIAYLSLLLTRYGSFRKGLSAILLNWKAVTITVVAAGTAALQVYIFQRFSRVGGGDQLNTGSLVTPFDVTGSPLHISHILFGVVVISFFVYLFKKAFDKKLNSLFLAVVVPWLALVVFVYVYQNATVGQNSYYLTKVVGLCLVATLVPFGAMLALASSKIRIPSLKLIAPILSLLVMFTLLLGAGQPLYGLNKLFPQNARTTYGTAEKIVKYLPKTTKGDAYIVVLTGRKSYENSREDNHGKLEMRVVRQPLNCAYEITGYISIKTAVKRLDKCADEPYMKNKTMYVLTSKASHRKVQALHKSNIIPIKTW